MTPRAVVVGAGIAGLATAISLRRIGWDVTVLERSEQLGDAGAGLSLAPNTMRALDLLGVGEAARAVSATTKATGNIRTPSGDYLVRAGDGTSAPLRGFRRADLHRVLLDGATPTSIRRGVEVTDVHSDGEWTVVEHREGIERAHLVVGADGIWSTVRNRVLPSATAPTFLNYTAWLGVAELPEAGAGMDGSMTVGRGRYFLIHPLGGNRYYWALGARSDKAGVRSAEERSVVVEQIGEWHEPIPRLVAATAAIRHIDIHDLPPLPTFVGDGVALVGDAAHAMSPDRGQGAAQGVEDAIVLAHALATHPTLDQALPHYDQTRRPKTQAIARDAARTGAMMLGFGRVGYGLFTGALRLTPSSLWQRMTGPDSNAIWRWTPPDLPQSGAV